jgi:hypothetical protein
MGRGAGGGRGFTHLYCTHSTSSASRSPNVCVCVCLSLGDYQCVRMSVHTTRVHSYRHAQSVPAVSATMVAPRMSPVPFRQCTLERGKVIIV